MPVEHALASVKRLRILRDEFRNRRKGMVDDVMMFGCTLHKLPMDLPPRSGGLKTKTTTPIVTTLFSTPYS